MWDSQIDDISRFVVRDIKGSEVINVCKKMSRSSLTRRACVVWRLRRLAVASFGGCLAYASDAND